MWEPEATFARKWELMLRAASEFVAMHDNGMGNETSRYGMMSTDMIRKLIATAVQSKYLWATRLLDSLNIDEKKYWSNEVAMT